jgi:hypothetical protein
MSCIDVTVMDDRQRTDKGGKHKEPARQNTQNRRFRTLCFTDNIYLLVHDWRMTLLRPLVKRLILPTELPGQLTQQAVELTQLERICLQ